jgi:PAS domain S-box-containing protein
MVLPWRRVETRPACPSGTTAATRYEVVGELTDARALASGSDRLVEEQEALRRVATLVADQAPPEAVFASVAEEIATMLSADRCAIGRFEAGDSMTIVAYWSNEEPKVPVGTRIDLEGDDVTAAVRTSRRPILIHDHEAFSGPLIDYARRLGALPRSTIAAPILIEGNVWGTIFASTITVEVGQGSEERVVHFAELVSTAIANAETRRELQRVAAEQRALRNAATLVASGAPPNDVFSAITTLASELFEVPFASLLRYEPDGKATMVAGCAACSGFVGHAWTVPDDDPGIIRRVVESRQPARIEDHTGVHGPLGEAARSLGIGSVVGVPVIVDGSVWGVLAVGAPLDGTPLPVDASERLVGFTELATTTLVNAETRDSLRRLVDEQAALRRVATLVAAGIEPEDLFSAVSDEVTRLFQVDAAGIGRFEADGSEVVAVGASERLREALGARQRVDQSFISREVFRTGRAARVDLRRIDAKDYGELAQRVLAMGFLSTVAAPIVVEGKLWGLLTASSARATLPADTESRVESFCELLATAIANADSRAALSAAEVRAIALADEQAALRRVATLVAEGVEPAELFAAVSSEIAQLLTADWAAVGRFEPDGAGAMLVGVNRELPGVSVGTRAQLGKGVVAGEIYRTWRPARNDDAGALREANDAARRFFSHGFTSTVGTPVVVEGELWGYIAAASMDRTLPADTEKRIESFGELIATAIANAESRAALAASEARTRALANEQAALRRVATLVAQGVSPNELFSAVAHEVAGIIDIPVVAVCRYEAGATFTILGIAGETTFTVGSRWPVGNDGIATTILETVRPSRRDDYSAMAGDLGEALREDGVVSTVGVPIVVEGTVWGFMIAAAKRGRPIPGDTESRLARFTELLATAISNAESREAVIVSRARIVTAADEAKRRIERNLHDGAQQRLLALGLDVQALRDAIPVDQQDTRIGLEAVRQDLEAVLEDVRELSHGLHPALLAQAGLERSLRSLARRSPVPVKLDVTVSERPSESSETAVYYVVSEALTNAAKHAQASEITVQIKASGSHIRATIKDNGIGGAEASAGSGLVGLIDRVDALGGRFALDSPPGCGTTISVEMPLTAEPIDARSTGERRSKLADGHLQPPDLPKPLDEALHAAVAASADALYIVDPQGRIRFLNPAALRVLGYAEERQLLGRPSHDTIHYLRHDGTPYPAAECPLLRPRVSGETIRVERDWFVRQDGSLIAVAYSSAPVHLPDGRGAVVSFRQISE